MNPKQLHEVTRKLAKASGVEEAEVKKVLDELGVASVPSLGPSVVEKISLKALQSAVRKALTVVIQ